MVSTSRFKEINEYRETHTLEETLQKFDLARDTLRRYDAWYKDTKISIEKKEGTVSWREWVKNIQDRQELQNKASCTQKNATIRMATKYPCIVFKPISDMHLGNAGVNYDRLLSFTESFLDIPYLYTGLLGDEIDNFVAFKSQLPVVSQILSPQEQDAFLESWIDEIGHKILFSCHGNHNEFEERVGGRNTVASLLSKNIVYFNGIGLCDMFLNDQYYKIVATHKTRSHSQLNSTHGLKQLARNSIPDADIYLSAHVHVPSYEFTFERGKHQLFMIMGTLKNNDTFAQRYFNYFSAVQDGAIVMHTDRHTVIPFPSLDDALLYAKGINKE